MQQVSFTSPGYDYSADQAKIDYQRRLAQALQQQSMQQTELPQTPAGGFTPSLGKLAGVDKLVQAFAASRKEKSAINEQRQLAQRSQADFRNVLATGLRQMQGTPGTPMSEDASSNVTPAQPAVAPNPMAAMGTFASHPMGQQLMPLAMQDIQRQQLIQTLRGAGGGQQAQAQPQPQPSAASGATATPAYGSSGFQPSGPPEMQRASPQAMMGPQSGVSPASGIPAEAWLAVDPSGKSYLNHLAEQGKTAGRVSYDQEGNAFTVMANGQVQRLPGVRARDKGEPVNLGGTTEFRNPYTGNQMGGSMQHSLTPAQALEIPMHQQKLWWETGLGSPQQPLPQSGGGSSPISVPSVPQAPRPVGPQSQPNPALIPPKDRAKLEEARPHQTQAATGTLNALQNSLDEVERMFNQPGLGNITGPVAGRTPNFSGVATNAQANLDTLKAQIGVHTLNAMREASKTGGAVGSVTEKEWPILQNQLGAIQQAQTTEEFKKGLQNVKDSIMRIQKGVRQSYESTYGKLDWSRPTSDNDPLGIRGK